MYNLSQQVLLKTNLFHNPIAWATIISLNQNNLYTITDGIHKATAKESDLIDSFPHIGALVVTNIFAEKYGHQPFEVYKIKDIRFSYDPYTKFKYEYYCTTNGTDTIILNRNEFSVLTPTNISEWLHDD